LSTCYGKPRAHAQAAVGKSGHPCSGAYAATVITGQRFAQANIIIFYRTQVFPDFLHAQRRESRSNAVRVPARTIIYRPACPTRWAAAARRAWPSRSKRTENNVKAQPNQRTGLRTVLSRLILVVKERSWARFSRLRDDITALALENVHLLREGPIEGATPSFTADPTRMVFALNISSNVPPPWSHRITIRRPVPLGDRSV